LIVKLMHDVNEHFKTVKNLLRKILPQPGFEPGNSCLAGAGVFPIRNLKCSLTSCINLTIKFICDVNSNLV